MISAIEEMTIEDIEHLINGGELNKREKADLCEALEARLKLERMKSSTVIGLVSPETKLLTKAIKRNVAGEWVEVEEQPEVYIPEKLEPLVRRPKRINIIYGGRGSAKSISVGDIKLVDARDNLAKTFCLREYQSSIKASIHSMMCEEIDRLEFDNFFPLQSSISYKGRVVFDFAGIARNVESIKSAFGFSNYIIEEAQFLSAESIQVLTPTARNKPNKGLPGQTGDMANLSNVKMYFIANLQSQQDPFSQKFIIPYMDILEREGIYEDDLRLIIRMNHTDNPWFEESGLVSEQEDDRNMVKEGHMDAALYEHIWEGGFNDSVENALIIREWFDACIDAHVVLGFPALGAKIASHDPADQGRDTKGYAMRHGSVVLNVTETHEGNVNDGGHWAAYLAIEDQVDEFSWDADGLGAGLGEQMSADLEGKKMQLGIFKGSQAPDFKEMLYKPALKEGIHKQLKNKEVFKNKRAQYYFELRDRIYRTYRAVKYGEYADPDTLISFSSEIPLLSQLRSELCRIPKKPNRNGLNELYSKDEMRSKLKIPSPNLADSVMMTMRYIPMTVQRQHQNLYIPSPISIMGSNR